MKRTLTALAAVLALALAAPALAAEPVPALDLDLGLTAQAGCDAPELAMTAIDAALAVDTLGDPGATACWEYWSEYRWVYAGCCHLGQSQRQQKRDCCWGGSTSCGSWYNTNTYRCISGPC